MNNLVLGPSGGIALLAGPDVSSPSPNDDSQSPQQVPFALDNNAQHPVVAQDASSAAPFTLEPTRSAPTIQIAQVTSNTQASESQAPSASVDSSTQATTTAISSSAATDTTATSTSASITVSSTSASPSPTSSSTILDSLASTLSDASTSSSSATSSSSTLPSSPTAVLSSTQTNHGPPFYIGLVLIGIVAVAVIAALIAWLVRIRSVSRRRRRYAASLNFPWTDDSGKHGATDEKTTGYAFGSSGAAFDYSTNTAIPPQLAHLPSTMDSRDHMGARPLQITNMNPGDNHSVPSSGVPSPMPNEHGMGVFEETMGTPRAQFAPRYMSVEDGGLELRPSLSARLRGRWKAQDQGEQGEQLDTFAPPSSTTAPPSDWTATFRQSVANAFSYALPTTLAPADNLTAGGPPARASTRVGRGSVRRRRAADLEQGGYVEYVGGDLVGLAVSRESTISAKSFAPSAKSFTTTSFAAPAFSRTSTSSAIPALDSYKGFDHAFSPNPATRGFEGGAPPVPRTLTMPDGMLMMPEGMETMDMLTMPAPAAVADTRVAPVSRMGSLAVPSRRDTLAIPSRVSSVASSMSKLSRGEEFARQRLVERAQRRRISSSVEAGELR
ncbi:hypothetical protein BD626DRAFT_525800 [Schizophyllum amplum]|uniref:Uncharacterized protein n=1 Tax=Schizophyllum amplum TaxID=97359 RepID=A0A550BSF6_9AGAR|nr:hypothetical protein BD626DRAFT_525800 [Auriculariopsis ampla]